MPEGSSGADIPTQALCALLCHYGRDEEDAPCLNKWNKEGREAGVVSRQEAIIQHSLKSILIWMFFFHRVLVFLFIYLLWNYVILYRSSVCAFAPFSCWVFLFACSRFPPLPLSQLPCAPPPPLPPPPSSPLFLCSFCSSEVYWISADSWNAEDKRGALSAPLREMVLHRGWVSGAFVCVWVSECIGGGGELMQRL